MTARKAKSEKKKTAWPTVAVILLVYILMSTWAVGVGVFGGLFLGALLFFMSACWMVMFAFLIFGGDPHPRMFVGGP